MSRTAISGVLCVSSRCMCSLGGTCASLPAMLQTRQINLRDFTGAAHPPEDIAPEADLEALLMQTDSVLSTRSSVSSTASAQLLHSHLPSSPGHSRRSSCLSINSGSGNSGVDLDGMLQVCVFVVFAFAHLLIYTLSRASVSLLRKTALFLSVVLLSRK